MNPPHYTFRPVIIDRHTAARAYFLSVLAMLLLESVARLSAYYPPSLLTKGRAPSRRAANHALPRIYLHKLLTLPSPLPFLTSHTVLSLLRCALFTALNILFGWNRIRYSTDYQLYGWLALANGGLALLLPTRTNLFSVVARIPAPTLLMYHRWAGVAAVVHASLHFGLTAQQYIQTHQFGIVAENARIRVGIMAWAALALMFITSLRVVRRRAFEVFCFVHFAFLVFAAGALYHASHAVEFLVPGLVLWGVDRAVRLYYAFGRGVAVLEVVHCPGGVTKLRIEGLETTRAGQMVWVQIPGVSTVNWHPFTVASAPGERGTVAIRGLGGYTRKVQQRLEGATGPNKEAPRGACGEGMKIRIDGPYGVESLRWARYPVVALVAGGIGITPAVSIASSIVNEAARGRLVVAGERRHVHLLWCIGAIAHAGWFEDELKGLAALASTEHSPVSLEISIHVTGTGSEREEQEVENSKYEGPGEVHRGRPDVASWFQHIKTVHPGCDVAVDLCGPRSLVDDGRRAAVDASSKGGLFFVQEEIFEL